MLERTAHEYPAHRVGLASVTVALLSSQGGGYVYPAPNATRPRSLGAGAWAVRCIAGQQVRASVRLVGRYNVGAGNDVGCVLASGHGLTTVTDAQRIFMATSIRTTTPPSTIGCVLLHSQTMVVPPNGEVALVTDTDPGLDDAIWQLVIEPPTVSGVYTAANVSALELGW